MFFLSPTGAVLTSEMAVDGDSKYKYYYYNEEQLIRKMQHVLDLYG